MVNRWANRFGFDQISLLAAARRPIASKLRFSALFMRIITPPAGPILQLRLVS
jgi:hypothetical protein